MGGPRVGGRCPPSSSPARIDHPLGLAHARPPPHLRVRLLRCAQNFLQDEERVAHVRGIHVDMEEAVQATCAKQGKKLEEVTQLCLDSSCKSTHVKVRVASKRTWDGEKNKDELEDEERLERRSRKRCVENHLHVEPAGCEKPQPPDVPTDCTIEERGSGRRGWSGKGAREECPRQEGNSTDKGLLAPEVDPRSKEACETVADGFASGTSGRTTGLDG